MATREHNPASRPLRAPSPLSPPRPFFLAGSQADERGSWSASSQDTSLEPSSDSERESVPPSAFTSRIRHRASPSTSPRSSTILAPSPRTRPPHHHRRRSSMANSPVQTDPPADPFTTPPTSPVQVPPQPPTPSPRPRANSATRPPPSSFVFPFQAYPGNPDPGTRIPGLGRRSSSLESITVQNVQRSDASNHTLPRSGSLSDLDRPHPPFMSGGSGGSRSGANTPVGASVSSNSVYRASAAAAMTSPSAISLNDVGNNNPASLPRSPSATFRAPFLSPASRPSSIWSPPSNPYTHFFANPTQSQQGASLSPNASASVLALPLTLPKAKPPLPSTRLPTKLAKEDKPWLDENDGRGRISWWLTFGLLLLGVVGAALLCWRGVQGVVMLDEGRLCNVLDERFETLDLDKTWTKDVQLGGFGNGEFQMATNSPNNLYISNSQLYILPTLTSDAIGTAAILDKGSYTLEGCTAASTNKSACTATSSAVKGLVINPVMSGRISTKGKVNIQYGKVEVRAKLPRGDWLWPAIWMLPEKETYGAWPQSGEIDIMEARGNRPSYSGQGSNYVRSTLNYGPLAGLLTSVYGWYSEKRGGFDQGFRTYGMEWDEKFMRFYTDSRVHAMLDLRLGGKGEGFWARGKYPETAQNGSAKVVVENPWEGRGGAAPFDQPFYLIIDLAVGGTSGWFPDNKGGKPWYDGSVTAMRDFARAQNTWYSTWPVSFDDRAFRIDSVKMWKLC